MINKIYKRIHNKYSKFFNFFFFLRHVFGIFLIAIVSFILIPKFFDYEKKQEILKEYLVNYYDLELNNFSSIKFKVFPLPNLAIKDANFKVKNQPVLFTTKNFKIFLKIKNFYNYDDFIARKILLNDSKIILDIDKTKDLFNYFATLKYEFDIQKLNLNLRRKKNSIIVIKKINFSNYGYKKNKINGEIFDKKFEAYLDNDYKNLKLKILHTGINANFNFDEMIKAGSLGGSSKISVLNNYLKSKFLIKNKQLEIIKANLRSKDLSVSFDSLIKFDPYFEISSDISINKIDKKLINKLSLEKILKNPEMLKKFNSNNKVTYIKKRSFNSLIKSHFSELNLAHGRLVFFNKTSVSGGVINCKGDSLLVEEYPRIYFDCFFDLKNKKEFFKKFSISEKLDRNSLELNVVGSLNLFNKKINFEKIIIDKTSSTIKKEDLNYFKETFENVLFDDNFFNIFRKDKIKEFLLEII